MSYNLTYSTWGKSEIRAVKKVISSGHFTMGKNVKNFENKFSRYFGKKYGVMVNSGSSANLVSIASLFYKKINPLKAGDEVLVPSISWSTTYFPLQQYGLKLKFIDVDPKTLNIDIESVKKNISKKTKLILVVSILGNPAELPELKKICNKRKIYLMEDNCESMDAEIKGKKTGTFGITNTFSFFYSHHISTMEGGIVLTDNTEIYHIILALRAHGWTRNIPRRNKIFKIKKSSFYEDYRFILPGYNLRPLEISAAAGIEQLKKLPAMTKQRRRNWKHFQTLFKNDEKFTIQEENGKTSSFCFTLILKPQYKHMKKKIFESLRKNKIGFRMITGGCILKHDVAKFLKFSKGSSLKNAFYAHENGFFVGNSSKNLSKEITLLKKTLNKINV